MTEYRLVASNLDGSVSTAQFGKTEITFDSSATRQLDWAGPAELLCAAFAACCLKNVSRFKELLHFTCDHAEIEVVVVREDKPPRMVAIRYRLWLATTESEHRLLLLQKNLEQYGTIYNTLKASCEVSGELLRR